MPPRHSRPRAQQDQAESSIEAGYEIDLQEHLAQTLGRGGFSYPINRTGQEVESHSFEGSTDLVEALS